MRGCRRAIAPPSGKSRRVRRSVCVTGWARRRGRPGSGPWRASPSGNVNADAVSFIAAQDQPPAAKTFRGGRRHDPSLQGFSAGGATRRRHWVVIAGPVSTPVGRSDRANRQPSVIWPICRRSRRGKRGKSPAKQRHKFLEDFQAIWLTHSSRAPEVCVVDQQQAAAGQKTFDPARGLGGVVSA